MTDQAPTTEASLPFPTPSEPERFRSWVDASTALEGFWSSAPSWPPTTAHREVDGVELIWTDDGILSVAPPAAVVARFFDGEATLRELAEDLADAAEVDERDAAVLVSIVAAELHAFGALDDVVVADPPPPDPSSPESDEHTPFEPESVAPDVVRVEHGVDPHGNKLTTEYLVDGTRRVTSELTFGFGADRQAASAAERLAAELMEGTRSAAELVPRDSCLGSKLRDDEGVPLVTVRCADGRLRSVRCHDDEVRARLAKFAGNRLAMPEDRGPIEAFVVTPLEGDGPLRIYDHRGMRRGRPRTVDEAVTIVDQLLGESVARGGSSPEAAVLLNGLIAQREGEALLIAQEAVGPFLPRRELRRRGWSLSAGLAVVDDDGRLAVPSALDEPTSMATFRLVGYPATSTADVVPLLVEQAASSSLDAASALERIIELSRRAQAPLELAAVLT